MNSTDSSADFVLTRVFDAPRELVFRTMTEGAHLQKWWGPKGCTIDVLEHTLHVGGAFHYAMRFGAVVAVYGKFTYREITPVERIIFTNGFADAEGNRVHYQAIPTWPLEVLNTITLTEADGKTSMTLHSAPFNAGEVEVATFKAGHASMTEGFGGMYDVYADYLATLTA